MTTPTLISSLCLLLLPRPPHFSAFILSVVILGLSAGVIGAPKITAGYFPSMVTLAVFTFVSTLIGCVVAGNEVSAAVWRHCLFLPHHGACILMDR